MAAKEEACSLDLSGCEANESDTDSPDTSWSDIVTNLDDIVIDGGDQESLKPYMYEPYESDQSAHDHDGDDDHGDFELDRLQNKTWCTCGICTIMTTAEECICCQEIPAIVTKCGDRQPTVPCITQHTGFAPVCLNADVLGVAYYQYRQQYNVDDSKKRPDERRHVAYRQFVRFCWHWLGRDIRRVIPACVVTAIRAAFPSPNGQYLGFRGAGYRD